MAASMRRLRCADSDLAGSCASPTHRCSAGPPSTGAGLGLPRPMAAWIRARTGARGGRRAMRAGFRAPGAGTGRRDARRRGPRRDVQERTLP